MYMKRKTERRKIICHPSINISTFATISIFKMAAVSVINKDYSLENNLPKVKGVHRSATTLRNNDAVVPEIRAAENNWS